MKILSQFETRGNIELLSQNRIAVFASKETAQQLFTPSYELFKKLIQNPVSIASGWHAPLEKDLLDLCTARMPANIIYYSAKDIGQIKQSPLLTALEKEQKLLVVSAQSKQARASKTGVDKRDELLLSQIKKVLFFYIAPGGRLEEYFNMLLKGDYEIFLFEHKLNKIFYNSGCTLINEDNLGLILT